MKKDDEIIDCYCYEAACDATFEAVLDVLVEEAAATGGFAMMFGPPEMFEGFEVGGDGEPSAPGARGPTVRYPGSEFGSR